MKKGRRLAAVAAVAVVGLLSTACAGSHIHPSLGEYAITTGHGYFSSQDVINVASPGQNVKLGSGTTTWYFPANVRNFVTIADGTGDRKTPTASFTGALPHQPNTAISAYVYTYVGWEINPQITINNTARQDVGGRMQSVPWAFGSHFLQFCLKYGCATQQPQNTSANAQKERSSDPGWLNMVDEIFPRAVDNATRSALVNFSPAIWTAAGEAQWPKLADEISANLSAELQALDGSASEGQPDYFCGPGSTPSITLQVGGKNVTKAADCKPFLVQVSSIVPTDPGVVQAYNLEQQANYAKQAASARLALAQELYGRDAGWFLGMTDLITKCQAQKVPCTFYVGNAPFHP